MSIEAPGAPSGTLPPAQPAAVTGARRRKEARRGFQGILYLVVIGVLAALASGVFRKDEGILILPVTCLIAAILVVLCFRRFRRP